MKTANDYLRHVADAGSRIAEYVSETNEADFVADYKTQDAIIRQIEILGEAGKKRETGGRFSCLTLGG
jgi:uncharacterized protein with HEPN domain